MYNFQFQNPTKLIFGRGMIASLKREIPQGAKIMITFGGGSVKKNGVYDQVIEALKGFDYIEFWGIEPNPRIETLRKAIEIGKKEGVDFLLAVGGGSVADGTKLIAAAIPSSADGWELVIESAPIGECVAMATVMTLPATGSEMNPTAVISNETTGEKYAVRPTYPKFSILDPTTTFSLPKYQIACGVTDTYIHVMEQYMTECNHSPIMDRWAEGIMLTLRETAPKIMANPQDYDQMANYMLCATMGLNGFLSIGVPQDWATHMIGHEITALTGITHGHTLSIVMPAVMEVMREQKGDKILQYAERVCGITTGSREERITAAIRSTEDFFRSLGLKTRLSENNVAQDVTNEVVSRFKQRGTRLGERENITSEVVAQILNVCR